MKKLFILLILLGVFCISALAQSTEQTRPRVVEIPANTPPPADSEDTYADTYLAPPPPMPIIDLEDVIKVNTNLVKLPVSVLDKNGRFIGELGQTDFQTFHRIAAQMLDNT